MPQAQPIVYVVDDNASFAKALGLAVQAQGYPVQTFASAQRFLDSVDPSRPGCLVLDVRMPGMSGLELQSEVAARGLPLVVVIMTGHGDVPIAVEAMRKGAFDFIEKPFRNDLLLQRIAQALEKLNLIQQSQAQVACFQQRLSGLTQRERQVMDLVAEGKLNKEIAFGLGIAEKTVKNHRASVMGKLQIDSVAELVRSLTTLQMSQSS
jgi:two-component system, LuxR family, response regulator FixJ